MYLAISDLTTTVDLRGTSPVLGCTYFPQTSQRRNGEWQPVTEQAEVNMRGTEAAIRATVNGIETLLQQAMLRQDTGVGARVFVLYKPVDTDAAVYKSEISDGRVTWSTDPGLRRLNDTNPPVQVAVIWTRAPGWDGGETEISISANGQAAATGGRTVTNNAANGDWLQMAAAQVTGDMPTPIRLEMTNTVGSAQPYRKLFLAVNAYSDPANLVHYLQGEAVVSGGTPTVDATCSGGNTLDIAASTPVVTYQWTLPQADMQRTKGRRARIIARMEYTGTVYIRPKILDGGGAQTLWQGDELAFNAPAGAEATEDLGIVPLPPGGYTAGYAAQRLGLAIRGAGVVLDVMQLTMIDSYRYMELASVSVANNATIVHDGIEGLNYVSTGGVLTPLATSYGGPLMLQPATLQRIYILHQLNKGDTAGAGDTPIAATMSVRAYYRPRRLTV